MLFKAVSAQIGAAFYFATYIIGVVFSFKNGIMAEIDPVLKPPSLKRVGYGRLEAACFVRGWPLTKVANRKEKGACE